jgi:putative salt-induced outer membrane protein YdiY
MEKIVKRILLSLVVTLLVVAVSARAEEPAAPKWTTSLNLGLNMNRGNSENTAANGSIISERKGEKHEVTLGAEGNYGQNEETQADGSKETKTTVQNEKGYAKYRYLFTDRNYGYLNGELSQDKIAEIKYRLVVGPGAGRYFVKSDKNTLGAETGISWVKDEVDDVEDDRFALRVAETYEWKISETAKIWQNVEYLPALDEFNNYLINGEVGVEAAMNKALSLRIVAQDRYNNKPAEGKEKNDIIVTAGIGYKL